MPNPIRGARPQKPIEAPEAPPDGAPARKPAPAQKQPSAGVQALMKQFAPKITVTHGPTPRALSDREKIARALQEQAGLEPEPKPVPSHTTGRAQSAPAPGRPAPDCAIEQVVETGTCGAAVIAAAACTAVGPADLAVMYFGGMACGAAVLVADKCRSGK